MQVIEMDDDLRQKVIKAVGSCPLFHGLDEEQLGQVVNITQLCQFEPDENIVDAGEDPDSFFLMMSGLASVRRIREDGEAIEVAIVRPPNTIGEMGIHIANNGGANAIAVSEQTMALMIAVSKKTMLHWDRAVRQRQWRGDLARFEIFEITN